MSWCFAFSVSRLRAYFQYLVHNVSPVIDNFSAAFSYKMGIYFFMNNFSTKEYARRSYQQSYPPNGYLVPVQICVYFLPRIKGASKRTKMHLNEYGLTKSEFCKSHIYLR